MKYFVVIGGSKGIGREFIKKTIKNEKNIVLLNISLWLILN